MGIPKLLLLFLVFSLSVGGIRADAGVAEDGPELEPPEDPSALRSELEQLRSKVAALESAVAEGNRQLKSKEETILEFETVVKEKSESIASLQAEIESLQKKGAVDAAELVGKAHARSAELEKQIENLKNDIQTQNQKRDALEAKAVEAENKVEQLQKTNDEQKGRIKKIERALEEAEEVLMKLVSEAYSKGKGSTEVGAWLYPWLASFLDQCEATATGHWNKHGKPAYDAFVLKISEILAQAHEKVESHLETARKAWIPALEERWATLRTSAEPCARLVTTKAVEIYETSVTSLKRHLIRVQAAADPYLQEARKFSKQYIDQIATMTKPHAEKFLVVLNPYTKMVVRVYGRSLKSATRYHHQVQTAVKERLKKHELTKALATKEFVWFAASALLALPIFFALLLLASLSRKKPRKSTHSAHANPPRRHKRRHADK